MKRGRSHHEKEKQGGDVVTPNVIPVRTRRGAARYSKSPNSHSSESKPLSIAEGGGTPLEGIPNEVEQIKVNVITPRARPVRERKAVERYSMSSPDSHSSGSKPLSVAEGSGTSLKVILNAKPESKLNEDSKRNSVGNNNELEKEGDNVVTPNVRPVRERKAVDRCSMFLDSCSSGSNLLSIAKGSGTPIEDIPNAFAMDVPAKPESKLNENSERYSVGNNSEKEKEGGNVVTPNGRPVREKKAVERYTISSFNGHSSGSKSLSIAKGSGTPLKDIPNVAFKLSKRKPDDTLQLLHIILFGKKAKVHTLKKDIGLFSGFVWEENEEKQRAKMKEKLDKCVRDKLLDFCDVLNIPVHKTAVKKEILTKLWEFLESPHATTEVLLADEEQKSKKQKRSATSSRSRSSKKEACENSAEKTQSGEKRKKSATVEGNETNDIGDKPSNQSLSPGGGEDVLQNQGSDRERINSDKKSDEVKDKKTRRKSSSENNSKEKSGTKSPASKKRQKVDEETKHKKSISVGKSLSKQTRKSAKSVGAKEKTIEADKVEPTREQLHAVAVNILKEVDFDTATLSDIVRLLGSHFGVDLNHRKSEIKAIVEEVIESMSVGDSDESEDADNGENGGDNGEAN